jgi:hypothetical protein
MQYIALTELELPLLLLLLLLLLLQVIHRSNDIAYGLAAAQLQRQ